MDKIEELKNLFGKSEEYKLCISVANGRAFVTDLGNGNPNANIFFCGEAPGAAEERLGIPFVGKAGKNLDENLRLIGLSRKDVWIGNVVRFRPTKNNGKRNRLPNRKEIEACLPLLKKEIAIIDPHVIVTLGKTPLKALTGKNLPMSEVAGKTIDYDDKIIYAMYHPAAVIYNKNLKEKIIEDFKNLKLLIR